MKVTWKRHRSARSIVAAYLGGPDGIPAEEVTADMSNGETWTLKDYVRAITREGKWAFCETKATPVVVHYWHRADVDPIALAFMLGHELGHASGKPVRNDLKEEHRADEYGDVTATVLRLLRRKRVIA